MEYNIRPAIFPEERETVRELLREYQADIGIDLCFQGFQKELEDLPGKYAPPEGILLCVQAVGRVVGCVALRPLGHGAAEMKRLFIKPAYRGRGIAGELVSELVRRARGSGYARIFLDTVPGMERAQRLYMSLGFHEIDAYTSNPVPGARYMALDL
jgi:ribosomal protein S18 acetylase RimI-like enzyme